MKQIVGQSNPDDELVQGVPSDVDDLDYINFRIRKMEFLGGFTQLTVFFVDEASLFASEFD
jgi:hypothetical protein